MYEIEITYPDFALAPVPGFLFLPGYPLVVDADQECPLCSQPLTDLGPNADGTPAVGDLALGEHRGYLADGDELMHLRCAMDLVEMGSLAFSTGRSRSVGRHAA